MKMGTPRPHTKRSMSCVILQRVAPSTDYLAARRLQEDTKSHDDLDMLHYLVINVLSIGLTF
jgi:hypothetical protein